MIVTRLRESIELLCTEISNLNLRHMEMTAEIERLMAALEPFQRDVEAVSLINALGHITREHLLAARHAFAPKERKG